MQQFWNERYGQQEMAYGLEPNDFLREQLHVLKPGRLLLPAEGEGRNAVFAAKQGWDVLAFDYSEAGQVKALALAAQQSVSIDYRLADAGSFTLEPESVDAVALVYAHLPAPVRLGLHSKVQKWLKPGGVVILEAFHPKQLGYTSGGPKDKTMLYTADLLEQDFAGMEIKVLEEQEVVLHEGVYHSGPGFVTRLVAAKTTIETIQTK
ncbi:class I SAM-dependent methyltransferase [Pontibacter ramchanderi]|uniref:Methyltransferase family protein n=1 Tax=Pontibacter ramchanderi TaxID=1179743 RepID=A0A2N3V0L2_9BACT|nr:class I SAM-dependent methyltransferase [Pontibacter ramchanderi]PKV75167.1 methyltransferase family protein [Pontibacter ramchanderi]